MPYKDALMQKAAQKAWYERNKKEVSRRVRDRRTTKRQYVRDYKLNNPICTDCKISWPPHILDFDHLHNKRFTISGRGVKDFGLNAIIEEIKKCEIVCSNCHRHRTYMRSADVPKKASSSSG